MSRLFMNQLQFEFGLLPTKINKENKEQYIEALVATRAHEDIQIIHIFIEYAVHYGRVYIFDISSQKHRYSLPFW